MRCSKIFDFKATFVTEDKSNLVVDPNAVILLPNIRDGHFQHKEVNRIGKTLFPLHTKKYYSVDMNTGPVVLSEATRSAKLNALLDVYPSQKEYIMEHAACWMFESLVNDDIETSITVRTRFEGLHCYPNAPEEVSFLRNLHRHVFHVDVTLTVFHDDRDVEFFILQREIDKFISEHVSQLDNKSCEMIARTIFNYIFDKYSNRDYYEVSVSEDGENGATVKFRMRG